MRQNVWVARVISVGVVALLVAVASASASRAHTSSVRATQKAVRVPLPAHADRKKGAGLSQVVCPSTTECVAIGAYDETRRAPFGHPLVLGWHRGKWMVEAAPAGVFFSIPGCLVGSPGGCRQLQLACPSLGSCVAIGHHASGRPVFLTQNGRRWGVSEVQLPSGSGLGGVSCSSAGNCTATSAYSPDSNGVFPFRSVPLLVSESNRTWGTAVEVSLPPDVATTSDPDGFVGAGGSLSFVSCPAAGECVALGSYAELVTGQYGPEWLVEPWITTEEDGQWQPGVKVQLPAGASTQSLHGNDPFIGFTGLSCPSAGNCTAVGGYNGAGGEQGLILIERNGVWLPPIQAPLPDAHEPPNWPNEFDDPLGAVSCAAPDDCAAVGFLGGYDAGPWLGWLLSERHGTWHASTATLALPHGGVTEPSDVFLNSITCPSAGNCVAVGTYHGSKYGLIEIERNGKWQPGIKAALPSDAAGPKKTSTTLTSVSCMSTNRCTVVGQYRARSGNLKGLIIDLRLR